MHSYHNFLFGFRFDKVDNVNKQDRHEYYKNVSFSDRVCIDTELQNRLRKDGWNYEKFTISTPQDYNELIYFYDFVKDSLYNTQKFEENATSYYFSKKIGNNAKYKIYLKDKEAPYELTISGISLRIFDTGIGILSIELENKKYSAFDDILKINEFGRRIYPQFLGDNFSLDGVKNTFLADKIEIILDEQRQYSEDFNNIEYKNIHNLTPIGSHILQLLGINSFTNDYVNRSALNFIQTIIDDRMFVISWHANNVILNLDNTIFSDEWYKYVFVDGGNLTVQDEDMQKKLINKATYTRWRNYKTLYGMSRYSFVLLTNKSDFSMNVLLTHLKTIYFQIFTLLLAQRASILRFSDEVTAISDVRGNDKEVSKRVSNLYENYIRFVNKLYFREITAQDQGIEIYDLARETMQIDRNIKDLDNEIDELHRYATMLDEKKKNDKMNHLSKLGYLFLPPTFVAGFFGMNTFGEGWLNNIGGFFLSICLIFCSVVFTVKRNNIDIKGFFKIN